MITNDFVDPLLITGHIFQFQKHLPNGLAQNLVQTFMVPRRTDPKDFSDHLTFHATSSLTFIVSDQNVLTILSNILRTNASKTNDIPSSIS